MFTTRADREGGAGKVLLPVEEQVFFGPGTTEDEEPASLAGWILGRDVVHGGSP